MKKIPTAEEFIKQMRDDCLVDFMRNADRILVENKLIQFAKLHVKEALKAASEKHKPKLYIKGLYKSAKWSELKDGETYNPLENSIMTKTDKKSIINSYTLKNII